jgi:hypothetical protein
MMQERVPATPEERRAFVNRFRYAFARRMAKRRKEIHRQSIDGGCTLLWPGSWKRPEDYLAESAALMDQPPH